MNQTRTVSVTIAASADRAYRYLAEPANFPKWSAFITSVAPDGRGGWIATTPEATVNVRFATANAFGVVDHWVRVNERLEVYVPLRVLVNGTGCEVIFTVFRQSGMTDEAFEADVAMVVADLGRLKSALESAPAWGLAAGGG